MDVANKWHIMVIGATILVHKLLNMLQLLVVIN